MTSLGPVRTLDSLDELVDATGGHPVTVLDVGSGFRPPAYAVGTGAAATVAFHRPSDHGVPGSAVIGTGAGLQALLAEADVRAWLLTGGNRHLSVPRGLVGRVEAALDVGTRGGEWDWLFTRREPAPVSGEERVVVLDTSSRDEADAFLTAHSPRTHGQPFARPGQHWVGVRDAHTGALVALGGSEPTPSGVPTLAGIAVAADQRGRGWGAAVTAHLTRSAVAGTGACVLGMFADNDGARRVYHRLGFTTAMEWTSRWFG